MSLYSEFKVWFELIFVKFIGANGISLAVLLSVFIFRNPLGQFLGRLIKIGPQGAEAFTPLQQSGAATPSAELATATTPPLIADSDLQTIINAIEPLVEQRKTSQEKIGFLVWSLATAIRQASFEQTMRIMYASQFSLLKRLNDGSRLSTSDLRPFYDQYVEKAKASSLEVSTLPNWLQFLIISNLVTQNEDKVAITERGKQMLIYQVTQSRPEPFAL